MAQRISRAKTTIAGAGGRFEMPPDADRPRSTTRRPPCPLPDVQRGLHGLFGRRPPPARACRGGHPPDPRRPSATPDDDEVAGLLALMLLTDARRPARTDGNGNLIPLADQDRSSWDRAAIDEGVDIITETLPRGRIGPYQLQAAIAAIHDEAPRAEDTDWREIVGAIPAPRAGLPEPDGHAEPRRRRRRWSMVRRPASRCSTSSKPTSGSPKHHRLEAVRAHLLEMAGRRRRRAGRVPARGAADDEHSGAPLSRGPRRPVDAPFYWTVNPPTMPSGERLMPGQVRSR